MIRQDLMRNFGFLIGHGLEFLVCKSLFPLLNKQQ